MNTPTAEAIAMAVDEYILESEICLEVPAEFVREIFEAGARWQLMKIMGNRTDAKHAN